MDLFLTLHPATGCLDGIYTMQSKSATTMRKQIWKVACALFPTQQTLQARAGHAQVCGASEDAVEELVDGDAALPGEGAEGQRSAGDRPFSAKHARQQASIVGHLRRLGLLEVTGKGV